MNEINEYYKYRFNYLDKKSHRNEKWVIKQNKKVILQMIIMK